MAMDYRIVVYPIETEAGTQWAAEYPDLRGCIGGGYTAIEAIQEAEENKEVFLNELKELGKEIPIPKTEIEFSGKFTVRITKSAHKKLAEAAECEGVSINSFVAEIINQKLGECKIVNEILQNTEMVDKLSLLVKDTDSLINNTRNLLHDHSSSMSKTFNISALNNYNAFTKNFN